MSILRQQDIEEYFRHKLTADPTYVDRVSSVVYNTPDTADIDVGPPALNRPPPQIQKPSSPLDDKTTRNAADFGSALISSIANRNPAIFAETAIRKAIASNIPSITSKQASLYDESTSTKYASSSERNALKVIQACPPVSVLLLALDRIFGDVYLGWEPETVMWELMDRNVQIDQRLLDAINCAMLLALQPGFVNDWHIFENCVLAMNNIHVHAHHVQKPDIAHMCAAVMEASIIFDRFQKDAISDATMDDDVELYVATALKHDNYIIAPVELAFAQDNLESISTNNDIVPILKKEWDSYLDGIVEGDPRILQEDDVVDVQLGKLAGCWWFVEERLRLIQSFTEQL